MSRSARRLAIALVVLLVLAAAAVVGLRVAAQQLQSHIVQALGPRASIGALRAGWAGIEVEELRIQAPPGWPAGDELRARHVQITPDLRSLFGGPWRIARIGVDGGYVSMLRTRDGRLRLLPALLEERRSEAKAEEASTADAGKPLLVIGSVQLRDATVAFFDASVRQPPHPLRLEKLRVDAGPFVLPALDEAVKVALDGIFKGPQRDGTLAIDGELTPATRDATVHARLRGVDLVALQPYLLKATEAGVKRGTLDLEVRAGVQRNTLHAPGQVTLSGLELASGGGVLGTFAGVPRQAVLAAMSDKGRIDVKFTLDGRLDDPRFSLNENFATRLASGLAETLGVSVSGVVRGVEGVVKSLFGK
jgi:uncharacterized protein YhdP